MGVENTDYREESLDLNNPFDIKLISEFLEPLGFIFESQDVDYSMILYNLNGEVIGTGSYQGRVLKYVAVAPKFREGAAFAQIVTHLIDLVILKHKHIFVYTKPRNLEVFKGLGFTEIATAEPLFSVLEFGYENVKTYQDYLRSVRREISVGDVAAVVVNCNPFTKGHKYLIEKACKENRLVYLFIVEEDRSSFTFDIRWRLIEEELGHIDNLVMVKGGNYVVSGTIFPCYFLKEEKECDIAAKQAELDVITFMHYIVPVLNITRRYVGTEMYSPVTAAYNEAMIKYLPSNGVELKEIPRITNGDEDNYISASKVRAAIREDRLNDVINFLPDSTKNFLLSEESKEIREKIRNTISRH
ncbi:[citrate (pro-3S)-lyase] ligase [Marinifilum sp. N1E240]|uniref:[citrate (pro-3S)-lyase] ligase n=1 Tax=Marinifilum sp. N1E240 TaxID=2608082 RepID=UPI00128D15EE|nr:[citrate (pro-3S)-lyase] ligase [Marinifilum sp. N1E240]MPQ47807.1 [citrate (pro-3S)-lyase] ligase [Marinifilum sp. N1E240]